jgi:hypothetical protein
MADIKALLEEVIGNFLAEHPELVTEAKQDAEDVGQGVTGFYDLIRGLVKTLPPMSGPEQEAAEQAIAGHQAEHEQLVARAGLQPTDPAPAPAPVTQE